MNLCNGNGDKRFSTLWIRLACIIFMLATLPALNLSAQSLISLKNLPVQGDTLVLGPFQGRPACIEIGPGKGVCGTAAALNRTQLVPDVHAFPGHIACDSASNSEIVTPLRRPDGTVFGVLDIDSPSLSRFTEEDRAGLEAFAAILSDEIGVYYPAV